MSNQAIVPSEFDAAGISFTEPKKVKSRDGKNTTTRGYMLYQDKLRYWETPWIRAPFGVRAFEAKDGESSNYSLNISARAVDQNEQDLVDNWFAQWEQVDEMFTDHVLMHSKTAIGKQYKEGQREVVQALQTRVVKAGDEDENGIPYPSRLAPKISRDSDDPNRPGVAIYIGDSTEDADIATFDELENLVGKGARVRLILQPKLWFISGKCGIALRVLQIQVQPTGGAKLHGFAFSQSALPVGGTANADADAEEVNEENSQVEDSGEEVEEEVDEDDLEE